MCPELNISEYPYQHKSNYILGIIRYFQDINSIAGLGTIKFSLRKENPYEITPSETKAILNDLLNKDYISCGFKILGTKGLFGYILKDSP